MQTHKDCYCTERALPAPWNHECAYDILNIIIKGTVSERTVTICQSGLLVNFIQAESDLFAFRDTVTEFLPFAAAIKSPPMYLCLLYHRWVNLTKLRLLPLDMLVGSLQFLRIHLQ